MMEAKPNMKQYLSIDRIEGDYAVCVGDDLRGESILLSLLPKGVCEGDVIVREGEGYRLDAEETKRRRAKNADLQRELFEG